MRDRQRVGAHARADESAGERVEGPLHAAAPMELERLVGRDPIPVLRRVRGGEAGADAVELRAAARADVEQAVVVAGKVDGGLGGRSKKRVSLFAPST